MCQVLTGMRSTVEVQSFRAVSEVFEEKLTLRLSGTRLGRWLTT